ncbi:hypothetical protein [Nocardia paucivorans]|uniref:hypothetical protein n=1 Tax=Nocardia paucivorans TaxID=114259 RepID=UPI0002FA51CC|nr:hypothetical protein [Nocardia paucivorans]
MGISRVTSTRLDRFDRTAFDDALSFVRGAEVETVLAAMVPRLTGRQRAAVAAHTVVAHTAALVFPATLEALVAELRGLGLAVGAPIPSVVVRDRLGQRYALDIGSLNVTIFHVREHADITGSPTVELFALLVAAGGNSARIVDRERSERNESHIALQLAPTDHATAAEMTALLLEHGGLLPDGGGYNSFEDCTSLYFRSPRTDGPLPYRRLELRVRGRMPTDERQP